MRSLNTTARDGFLCPLFFFNMRIREPRFYVVRCQRNEEELTVEIEDTDSPGVDDMITRLFNGRMRPTRDENGKYKKLPYTMVSVTEIDKVLKQMRKVSSRKIYNLSPAQVRTRILNNIHK